MYKIFLCSLVVGICLLIFQWEFLPSNPCYFFNFLDIGQGDSVLIRTPKNQNILIDGGPKQVVIDQLGKVMPWWDKHIDLVVLSHPHADHLEGLLEVIQRFKVEEFLLTGATYESAQNQALYEILANQDIATQFATRGLQRTYENLNFTVIHPENPLIGSEPNENINNTSVVAIVEVDGFKALFTGDAETEQEAELLELDQDYQANLFLAGHHGSRTSNSPELLYRTNPQFIVIQSGLGNQFGHPHSETIDLFKSLNANVFRNDLQGTISFKVCDGQVDSIKTSR